MKLLTCFLFVLLIFPGCKKKSSELLVNRWNFISMEMPGLERFLFEIREPGDEIDITIKKFFLSNKLILRKDSSFDMLLMNNYIHGSWHYDESLKSLELKDESAKKQNISFHVDTLNGNLLHIDTDEFIIEKLADKLVHKDRGYASLLHRQYYQFLLEADKEHFRHLADDLYSKENNWWRIKPSHPETHEQIKKRILNHLAFWRLLFHDANDQKRDFVSYSWFTSPLVVAANGVMLKLYDDVKKDWDENFYDSAQAHTGYELMRKCFSKKIKYLKTSNKHLRNEDIIKQLSENFLNTTSGKK